jgi:PAS domain S-box-containing protein
MKLDDPEDSLKGQTPGRPGSAIDPWAGVLGANNLIAAFTHDPAGRIVEANPAFCRMVGQGREDIVGSSLEVFIGPAGLRTYLGQLNQTPTGVPPRPGHTLVLKRAVGGAVHLDVEWFTADAAALVRVLGRVAAEEALRTSEETTRVLLDTASGAAFVMSATGIVLAANPAACERLGTSELVGRSLTEFLPADVAERRQQKGLEVLRTGRPLEFEDECLGRSFRTSIHPIRDAGDSVIRLVVSSQDITDDKRSVEEHRQLTQQLQQAQKMEAIGTLAGGIAHDFNNLLMAIQGNVSLAQFDLEPSDPQHRLLANIEKLIGSGAELTSKLLGYARRGKYESKPLLLNELVRETSETFGRMRKDISIHRILAENLKRIIADKGQLEQVLLNLFVNAADAMPAGGQLLLKTCNVTHHDIPAKGYHVVPGNYVRLEVHDTGVGIDPQIMDRIFDPFFTTKRMGRGTGLGLASAYGIVKGHGGYIIVESEKGQGSIFSVYLPATDQPVAPEPKPGGRIESGAGTILLVDDELTVLEVTACLIERLGYTVVKAASGREALGLFRDQQGFRLVILDMIMPEMSGGDVFDELKRINPAVKVLLASGYSLQGQAREIMNRGCTGFIQKPFTMEDLSLKLQTIMK